MKVDICGRCDVGLTLDNWWPSAKKRRWLICSTCSILNLRKYTLDSPDKVWNRNCKRRYGIDYQQYQEMLLKQDSSCAICCATEAGRGHAHFSVDHNHSTGRVRGLLCHNCNTGLGMFKDNIVFLKEAVEYLVEDAECT